MNHSSDLNLRLNDIEETLYAEFGDIRKMIRGIKPKAVAESYVPSEKPFTCRFKEASSQDFKEIQPATLQKFNQKRKQFLFLGVLGLSIILNLGMFWMINQNIQERIPTRQHIELMKHGARCTHDRD